MAVSKNKGGKKGAWGLWLAMVLVGVLILVGGIFLFTRKNDETKPANNRKEGVHSSNQTMELSGDLEPVLLDGPDVSLVSGGCTKEGFYYIEERPENMYEGNIRYVDFESQQDIFLSNLVNSSHNSEEDPSYLDSIIGWHTMFCSADKLYFLRGGAENADSPQNPIGAIYQMELDGSNRKCLYESNASSSLEPDVIRDEEHLYLFERGINGVSLVQIPIEGGTAAKTELPDFAQVGYCEGSRIYYYKSDRETANLQLAVYDLPSQQVSTLEIPIEGTPVFVNDKIYAFGGMYQSADPAKMRKVDLYDLQGRFLETLDLHSILPENSWGCAPPKAIGEKILWICWNDETKSYYTAVLDTASQELSKTLIPCRFDKNGEEQPAEIIAQAGDDFLIVNHRAEKGVQVANPDGTTSELVMERYEKALIPQADYFAGITENMKKIQMDER